MKTSLFNIRNIQYALCIILMLCLVGCTTKKAPPPLIKKAPIKKVVITQPLQPQAATIIPQTPKHYLQLAATQPDPSAQAHFQILAAQAYIKTQAFEQAKALIDSIRLFSLNSNDSIQYQFALAELALANNRPVDALEILKNLDSYNFNTQPIELQITREKLLASSYEAFGQALESIKIRLDLSLLLTDSVDEKNNKRAIWSLSQQLSDDTLQQLAQNYSQPTLAGWAQLTLISRQDQNDPQRLATSLQAWREKYPSHPANAFLTNLLPAAAVQPFAKPSIIGVVLPLSGNLKAQADAIWQGLLYAYYEMPVENRPTLIVYDNSQKKLPEIYDRAEKEGVNIVLGPLTKDQVMIARQHPKILTLTLNYSEQTAVKNIYEFGLNLTQDTEQIAERLQQDNLPNVLAITGEDANSISTLDSFTSQLEKQGGKIVSRLTLNSKINLDTAIPALLKFDPTTHEHRQDIDAIFMNLSAEQAKTLMPLLQHYGADNLPIYATSLINGDKSSNKDILNKVMFVDIPFIINPDDAALKAQEKLALVFPDNYKNFSKLYAVGMDAYALLFELSRLRIFPDSTYSGSTGILSLDKNQQIYHELTWAQFVNGDTVILPSRLNRS